jgi:hypothetical protein
MTAGKIVEPCPNPWCIARSPPLPCALKHDGWRVLCECGVASWRKPTEAEAIAEWNTRPEAATITSLTAEVERLRDAMAEARTTISVASSVLYSAEAYQTSNLCDDTIETIDAALAAIQPTDTE